MRSSVRQILPVLLLAPALYAARGLLPQYAPPDAYLPGDPVPFYGSENPWDRRFFDDPNRASQRELLDLVEGRVAESLANCRKHLEQDAGDLESRFVLALALAKQGKMAEAEQELGVALDLGFPVTRLLAGPRSLLEPFRGTKLWRTRVADRTYGLVHGPLLGAVTPGAARFWVRTEKESDVEIRVSRRGDFSRPDARGTAHSRAAVDFTAVVAVDGLQPATEYTYQVFIDGQLVPRESEWHFHTFPAEDHRGVVRVAFGGCAMYAPQNERIWDVIRLRQPDVFLTLGDNVYIDLPEKNGPVHDYSYYCRQSRPEFRRLVASIPTYAIWDDHDAGIDDIFLGPYKDRPAWKPDVFALFRRNWNNPSYGAEPEWPGVWFKFRLGQVEVFMLDGRYYRENWMRPHATMLGPIQKAWLEDALVKSTATFKLIVSPVALADDAKIELDPATGKEIEDKDTWHGHMEERTELYNLMADHKINGVFLISADRHRADLRKDERPRGYPLYELMCSRLTNPKGLGTSGRTLWAYDEGCSFAVLTLDTKAADPTLEMEVNTAEGRPVLNRTLKLSELSDP